MSNQMSYDPAFDMVEETAPQPEPAGDTFTYHLNACQNIALQRARNAFNNYLADLEDAFYVDINNVTHDQDAFESAVDRVLKEFRTDVKSITETLGELTTFSKNITERQQVLDKRYAIVMQSESRLRKAKIRVYEETMARTQGRELPSAVLLFLFQPWADFLCYNALRFGHGSAQWERALEVVDDLIWAVQFHLDPNYSTRMTELHALLPGEIHAGLATIRYNKGKADNLVNALTALMKPAGPAPAQPPLSEPVLLNDVYEDEEEATPSVEQVAQERQRAEEEQNMVEHLRMIEFGTWFEFNDGKRLKVAWFNARTSNYMLVDQSGKKVDMLSGLALSRLLLNKRARMIPVSAKPFLSRAFENILHKFHAAPAARRSDV